MNDNHHVLVVDDDDRICRTVSRLLKREGYSVATASDGSAMSEALTGRKPDLVILDLRLPDTDGFSLARELRSSSNMGIIILTGKTDMVDKVVGLELGADDYITKPFEERELLARVRSVLRRAGTASGGDRDPGLQVACFAGWRLDMTRHELHDSGGDKVALTTYEFSVLSAFVQRPNRVLSREMILDIVAGREWNPYDRSVDVIVGKLRKKIEDDPAKPTLITTIRGGGYKFTTVVKYESD